MTPPPDVVDRSPAGSARSRGRRFPWVLAVAILLAATLPALAQGGAAAPATPAPVASPAAPSPTPSPAASPALPAGVPTPIPGAPSLTLREAEAMALARNHTLAASTFNSQAAGQRVGQAAAALYPTLTLSANSSHNDVFGTNSSSARVVTTQGGGTNVPIVVNSDNTNSNNNLNANLTARETLLDFSRPYHLQQASQAELAALADLDGVRQDVLLGVRKAWFTAYIDQVVLDIRREAVENRQVRLVQAQGLYKGGTKARIDVATAESDLAQARLQALQAETQLQVDWVALNVAMGLAKETPYRLVLDPSWDAILDLVPERLVETAMARRPELRSLDARLRAQIASLQALGTNHLPTLSANATVAGSGQPTPLDGTWSVGLSLNWNLFDGFLSGYQAGEARATARSLAEQLEQERITVYQEVATRIVQVRQASAQIQAAETALATATESYRLASARYRVGVGSSLEVSDAELALSQAQTDLATAANALRTSRAELTRAVGAEDLADLPPPAPAVRPAPIPGVDQERSAP